MREIDNNSLCGPIRELPDSGKAELLDEASPSGSGHEIKEMCQSVPFVVHELGTHRSSKEQVMDTQTANKGNIVKSTEISRISCPSHESSDSTPCIETVISASTHRSSSELSPSTPGSTTATDVASPSLPKPEGLSSHKSTDEAIIPRSLDLNRSLPPTPISESPQLSPRSFDAGRAFSLRDASPFSDAFAIVSRPPPFSPQIPASKFSKALSGHEGYPLGGSLHGLETTIPPGQSDSDGSGVSALSPEEPVMNTTWL